MKAKTKMRFWELILCFIILFLIALMLGGCEESFGLRFSPTEPQRQSAELTYLLARRVNTEGLDPDSEAGEQLVKGTAASLTYTGRARTPVDPDEFDTVSEQAQNDALKRPDIGGVMDSALEIGLVIAGLVGGGTGIKIVRSLRRVHAKARGFNEVVGQVDTLKNNLETSVFRATFTGQTPMTRKLVAEASIDAKVQKGA